MVAPDRPTLRGKRLVNDKAVDRLAAHVGPHGQHALEGERHWLLLAGGQQVGQVANGDAEATDVRHAVRLADPTGGSRRLDGRQWRHVPDHRQRAIFGMKWEGDLPLHRHFPDRRLACCLDPRFRNAVGSGLRDHRRVLRIEEKLQLLLVEVLLVLGRGGSFDAVGVVKQHAEIADATDAGFRTDRRLAGLDARIAERCTSRICPKTSCSRSSCRDSRRRTCANHGICPDRSERCRPPRACRSPPTDRRRRRPD